MLAKENRLPLPERKKILVIYELHLTHAADEAHRVHHQKRQRLVRLLELSAFEGLS
jgi:hypothetical protein